MSETSKFVMASNAYVTATTTYWGMHLSLYSFILDPVVQLGGLPLVPPLLGKEEWEKVVLSRRVPVLLVAMVVVLALGIGLLGAVGSASSDNNAEKRSDKVGTLTVLTKTREVRVVDLGPQGPTHGDMRVVNAPLYNESGKERIGRLDLFCVTTDPADESSEKAHMAECTVTYTLPGGEISQQGVQPFPKLPELPAKNVESITGGTERYAGVRGDVLIEPRGNKVIHTFHFIG